MALACFFGTNHLKRKNIKYKNHSTAVYVRSSLKVHNPLFSVLANCDGMNFIGQYHVQQDQNDAGFSIEGGTRRLIAAYFGIYSRLLCV